MKCVGQGVCAKVNVGVDLQLRSNQQANRTEVRKVKNKGEGVDNSARTISGGKRGLRLALGFAGHWQDFRLTFQYTI